MNGTAVNNIATNGVGLQPFPKALPRAGEVLSALTILLFLVANYIVFCVVPNERVMGPVQRIFYFHVGAAIACYCAVAVLLFCALGYLATRDERYDIVGEASGEVGFVLATIVLLSGMIWGHSAWNTWFRWEPRLVSFLLLWLIFFGLNILRRFAEPGRIPQHAAVLAILAAITVPIVVFSVKLLPHMAQLHPQVVENRGLKHPAFKQAMFLCMALFVVFQAALIILRSRIGWIERVALLKDRERAARDS